MSKLTGGGGTLVMIRPKGKLPKVTQCRNVLPGCMVNSHATVVSKTGSIKTEGFLMPEETERCCNN